jgi:glycosyltransferase involved in cell wall biosynthesis
MKCLFACHDPPAPANNGGAIDMLGMLDGLARLGADVHLLMTVKSAAMPIDGKRLESSARRMQAIQRNLGPVAAMSLRPYQIASRRELEHVALDGPYDVVIASDHCSGVLLNPHLEAQYRILRRNNDEPLYAKRMAANEPRLAVRLFYQKESWLFRRWIARVDALADQVWYASEAEMIAAAAADSGSARPLRLSVPPAIQSGAARPPREVAIAEGRVLYFGSFTIPVNREGVDWFIENVHPQLRRRLPRYRLVVAGRVGPQEEEWARRYVGREDLDFIPNPRDPADVYAPGGLFVDPRAHDVGIKVKIVEAARHGYALVCSDNSLVGSGLSARVHARTAASAQDFVTAIETAIANPGSTMQMAREAQAEVQRRFDVVRSMGDALRLLGRKGACAGSLT